MIQLTNGLRPPPLRRKWCQDSFGDPASSETTGGVIAKSAIHTRQALDLPYSLKNLFP